MMTLSRSRQEVDKAISLMFAHHFRAYLECDPAIQGIVREMAEIITDPSADDDDRAMALSTLQEALFPACSPSDGHIGADLEDEDRHATDDETSVRAGMDREEASFASRVSELLRQRNMTQEELAGAIGVGQSAISMMLGRKARPQRRTVEKIARALDVAASELWPDRAGS